MLIFFLFSLISSDENSIKNQVFDGKNGKRIVFQEPDSVDDSKKEMKDEAIEDYDPEHYRDSFNDDMYDDRHGKGRKRKIPNCTFPNTKPGYRDECVCNDTYIGDNPIQERGCWKCKEKCHSQASCEYPGTCKCGHGLVGDGVGYCDQPKAIIKSCEAKKERFKYAEVECEFSNDFFPYYGWCKIGESVVQAKIKSKNSMSCMIPNKETNKVQISFDGKNWSETLEFSKQEEFKPLGFRDDDDMQQVSNNKNTKKEEEVGHHYLEMVVVFGCFVAIIYAMFLPIEKKPNYHNDDNYDANAQQSPAPPTTKVVQKHKETKRRI